MRAKALEVPANSTVMADATLSRSALLAQQVSIPATTRLEAQES